MKFVFLLYFLFSFFFFGKVSSFSEATVNYLPNHFFSLESNHSLSDIIFVITPTYNRANQIPELTRLGQTLSLVPRLHWIVVEDSETTNQQVERVIQKSRVWRYTYTAALAPPNSRHRGVPQRNLALQTVGDRIFNNDESGVIYFLDDDNIVTYYVFVELRKIKTVGYFPVGLTSKTYERCSVKKKKKDSYVINQIAAGWKGGRVFTVDMMSFGTHTSLFKNYFSKKGELPSFLLETGWLEQFISHPSEMVPLARNCRDLMAWHTRTKKNLKKPKKSNSFWS